MIVIRLRIWTRMLFRIVVMVRYRFVVIFRLWIIMLPNMVTVMVWLRIYMDAAPALVMTLAAVPSRLALQVVGVDQAVSVVVDLVVALCRVT
jgi:hypothetical protein